MGAQYVLDKFKKFEGKQLIDCADEIQRMANECGLKFNPRDPDAPRDIDRESNRLNVRVDDDFKILRFTLG